MNARRLFRVCCLALVAALAAGPAAAAPRDEVLRVVPDDVAFCLVVQDLRGHSAALAESPFAAQFRDSMLGKVLAAAPERRKLLEAAKALKEHLGITWEQFRDEILGDAIAAAYRPGPPGKPEQEQGLLVIRARNAALLATLIERLNEAQKKSGDLKKLDELEHNGVKYYRRVEKKQTYYYVVRGPVLAASGQEAMLRRAIDLDKQAPASDPPLARQLKQLGAESGLLALWINPRAFDADLEAKAKAAEGPEAVSLKNFLRYWKAIDGAAYRVTIQQDLEASLSVRARTDSLPPAARKFLAEAAKPSELWGSIPDNALLAVAGRVDVPALLEMLGEFLPDDARQALRAALDKEDQPFGKVAKEVLPCIGPDVGFCILAPAADEKSWVPHMIYAVRVQPGKGEVPAGQVLYDTLAVLGGLAVLDHNSKNPDKMSLKTTEQDKVEVKYFVNDKKFPPGFQPAFALKEGYLIFASSPEALRRFSAKGKAPAEGQEVPIARASLAALRTYLKDRRTAVAEYVAEKNEISLEEAGRRLDGLQLGLQLFDRAELTQRTTSGQIVLTLRVRPAQPFRK